jgi:hypothetical protein
MSRKVITASMALAALAAIVLPATASSAQLTSPTGTLVAAGATVKATNVGTSRLTDASGNTLTECSTTSMTAELIKNNGTEIEANITSVSSGGTGVAGECTSSFGGFTPKFNIGNGTPWCLKSVNGIDEFTIRGGRCTDAARSVTVVMDSTTVGICKYNRSAVLSGSFITDSSDGDAVLSMNSNEITKEEGGIFCPSSGRVDVSYTLEADEAGTTPMYIS